MDFIAVQKFVRVSPKKMRVVADVARKMTPLELIDKLPFLAKSGSEVVIKVVKSAISNAKQKGISDSDLLIKEIQIGEGPRLKRGRAASRGRWHPYKKRMSHVRVILAVKETKNIEKVEAAEKENDKKPEKKEISQKSKKLKK